MVIVDISDNNIDEVVDFLSNVNTIKYLDKDILKNGCAVFRDDKVVGVLTYEEIDAYAFVRYFVFKSSLSPDIVLDLFNHVLEKIKSQNFKKLITLINKEEMLSLFYNLGFTDLDRNFIFIEEANILNTNFKNTFVLALDIK